jgi:16S rRNA (uracil1498-N3)-methyltransferase
LTIARFYVSPDELKKSCLAIEGLAHHHLSRVLRIRLGQKVIVMDGEGSVGQATVREIGPSKSLLAVDTLIKMEKEEPGLHLFQALIQWKKMDRIVQYMVEMGVNSLIPFSCHRSRPLESLGADRVERWRNIAVESSRLAGRPYLPRVENPKDWEGALLSLQTFDEVLYADEEGGSRPAEVLGSRDNINIGMIVGPEGGFTDKERESLAAFGVSPVTLGDTILRAEIAGLVMTSALRCHYGLL